MPLRKNLRNFPDEVHFRLAEQIRQDLPQAWQVLGVGLMHSRFVLANFEHPLFRLKALL